MKQRASDGLSGALYDKRPVQKLAQRLAEAS